MFQNNPIAKFYAWYFRVDVKMILSVVRLFVYRYFDNLQINVLLEYFFFNSAPTKPIIIQKWNFFFILYEIITFITYRLLYQLRVGISLQCVRLMDEIQKKWTKLNSKDIFLLFSVFFLLKVHKSRLKGLDIQFTHRKLWFISHDSHFKNSEIFRSFLKMF